jgi:hypothetical protein
MQADFHLGSKVKHRRSNAVVTLSLKIAMA